MKAILLSAYQFRQIREMTATLAMPRRVAIASIARMNLLADRYLPNPVRLLGYKVSYADAGQLRDLFREIFVRTCYMFHTSERCPSIVDCGSNIGMSILFFKRLYPESRIIGFEPDPDTFAILQQNIEQNDLTDVIVHNCALSDHDGTIAFYQSNRTKSSLQMSIIPERGGDLRIDVPARRLSSFLTSDVDLLKMDIEGAESFQSWPTPTFCGVFGKFIWNITITCGATLTTFCILYDCWNRTTSATSCRPIRQTGQ